VLSSVGIKPEPKVYNSDGKLNKKLNTKIKKLWQIFNDNVCSYLPLQQNQNLMLNSILITGNLFIVRVKNPDKNPDFSFKIEFFDTSMLDFSHDTMVKLKDGSYIQYGIAYNKDGQPTKYYFKDDNIFDSKDVIHAYIPKITQQKIGVCSFAPALTLLYDNEMMIQNQNLTSRAAAGLLLWLKKSGIDDFNLSNDVIPMSPLSIIRTEEKPEIIQGSNRVSQEVIPLTKQNLQAVSACLGISYSSVSRDLTGESFSGGRLRNMMDENTYDMLYKLISKSCLQKIYEWFIEDIVLFRKIDVSIGDYKSDKYNFTNVYWFRKKPDYIDPLSQVRKDIEKRDAGLITDKELFEIEGKDLQEVYEQLKFEIETKKKLGIVSEKIVENVSKLDDEPKEEKKTDKEKE
jgi:lambda family phage portal protein